MTRPAVRDLLAANPVVLAPMAGVTDKAFRTLCIEHGAQITCSEMISAKGLEYANERTHHLIEPAPAEEHFAVQLFGHEPDVMAAQAVAVAEELGERLAFIDVNMGCPVPKVHKKGEGSGLMRTPDLAAEIVAAMVKACGPLGVEITAKIRSGWDDASVNAVEVARCLEQAGAAAIGVHGRTAKQLYRGKADWGVIADVARAVSVPVIGSGDVMSAADAKRMLQETGAAAAFVARGAMGNPWIFNGHEPTSAERIQAARRHLQLYVQFYGERYLSPLRAQLARYVYGQPGATDIRRALGAAQALADYERILADALERA